MSFVASSPFLATGGGVARSYRRCLRLLDTNVTAVNGDRAFRDYLRAEFRRERASQDDARRALASAEAYQLFLFWTAEKKNLKAKYCRGLTQQDMIQKTAQRVGLALPKLDQPDEADADAEETTITAKERKDAEMGRALAEQLFDKARAESPDGNVDMENVLAALAMKDGHASAKKDE